MAADAMITSSTTPVARPADTTASFRRLNERSRYTTTDTTPAYSVDSTATSVGVAMPKRRNSTISTGSSSAGDEYSRCTRNTRQSMGVRSRGELRRLPRHQHMNMKPPHISMPGRMPATNSAAMEALAVSANRIIGIEGGIRMSMVAAAASVAAEKAGG